MLCTAMFRRSNAPAFDVSSVTKQRVSKRKVHNVSTINSYHIPIWSKEYFDRVACRNPTLIPMAQTYPCSQDGNHRGDSSGWRIQSSGLVLVLSHRLSTHAFWDQPLVWNKLSHSLGSSSQRFNVMVWFKDLTAVFKRERHTHNMRGDKKSCSGIRL